jgi:membrane protein
VQDSLESQFGGLIGAGGAHAVGQMIASGQHGGHGVFATVASFVGLLLGATGAFLSLQQALNAVWQVGPDPKQGGVKPFIMKRLLSLGMLMGLAFLLVVSLAVSTVLSAIGNALGGAGAVMQVVTIVVSIIILGVLFAAMFKYLPDGVVPWRAVWVGGLTTAILFEIGKFVIGLYLGHSKPGSAFGGASALAVLLVWIYYAGMLVLFGAEFTQHWALAHGHEVQPKKGAIRIEREEHPVRGGDEAPSAKGRMSPPKTSRDGSVEPSAALIPSRVAAVNGLGSKARPARLGDLLVSVLVLAAARVLALHVAGRTRDT